MAQNGKRIPNCVYASNPYHECTDACSTKTKDTKPQKMKKGSDYRRTDGEHGKKMNGGRRTHPDCPKASNPYHDCDEYCNKGMSGADSGVKLARKKKLGSKPELPVLDSVPPSKVGAIYFSDVSSPIPQYSEKKKEELKSNGHISSKPVSGEMNYKDQPQFPKSEPASKNGMSINHKDQPMDSVEHVPFPIQANKEGEKNASHKVVPIPTDTEGLTTKAFGSKDFSFSGTPLSNEDSDDDEETRSIVSETRVPIGRYRVKESFAPILHAVIDKYGDIGASCHLESIVLRSYYVECVCFVVQELQSTSVMQLTKSKVKELLAILKDVESAEINVAWLRSIFNEITENMDIINQHQAMEVEKMNSDCDVESLRKELESDLETLAQKEEEVTGIKTRIAETRDRLKELELKSTELDKGMLSIKSKVDNLDSLSLLDELV
ncbi:hypothetical protein L6164_004734 [Bauhinia variegata]|uniref:Uncharacterized protein n=2 Tax=Bauhinia variegata TaxID=167791 RepID=A0ACB9PNG4_BAUVA|nr:hypothetical protein L6164_004734 [Bauhinia variegata]